MPRPDRDDDDRGKSPRSGGRGRSGGGSPASGTGAPGGRGGAPKASGGSRNASASRASGASRTGGTGSVGGGGARKRASGDAGAGRSQGRPGQGSDWRSEGRRGFGAGRQSDDRRRIGRSDRDDRHRGGSGDRDDSRRGGSRDRDDRRIAGPNPRRTAGSGERPGRSGSGRAQRDGVQSPRAERDGRDSQARGPAARARGERRDDGGRHGAPAGRNPQRSRDDDRAPRGWGSLARRSIRELGPDDEPGAARQAWRDAVDRARGEPEPWEPEVWIEEPIDDEPRPQRRPPRPGRTNPAKADRATKPGRTNPARADRATKPGPPAKAAKKRPDGGSSVRRRSLPKDVVNEVGEAVPPARADRYRERLAEAAKAYERDRYTDAARLLKPLAEVMPGASAVRELYGLTMYRLGRWNEAIRHLEAYRELEPASFDQHPTLADAYRAKKRWAEVEALWEELRGASPGAELVTEGRIVMAGALADQNRLAEAIELLEKARTDNKRPRPHHLRVWYALGDLYERAGEIPRARELFRRVFNADPELYDTADRLRSIG